jgi:OOP family OmpA-OmpF porin
MAIKKLFAVSAISLAVGIMSVTLSTTTFAEDDGMVKEYVTNPYGEVYKNSYGECWRDRFTETDVKLEECGYVPEPVEEEVVVVIECEEQVVISDLTFAFDSATLTEEDKASLADEVAHVRRINEGECERVTGARLVGHTDSIGSEEYNLGLSERRAAAVRDYLETQEGVTQHMEVLGMGETDPIADNSTKEGRAQNRRVVIELLH